MASIAPRTLNRVRRQFTVGHDLQVRLQGAQCECSLKTEEKIERQCGQ